VVGTGGQRRLQIPGQPRQSACNVVELAVPPLLVNPGDLLPQHRDGQDHPFRVAGLYRVQREPYRLYGAVGMPVSGGRYREPGQLRGGDLERVGESEYLREGRGMLAVLDPPQRRRAHPGQSGDHPQRLAPIVADLPQPPADRLRFLSVHQVPLHSPE